MTNSTFYLKYRPQKISQLDLKEVREKLEKILSGAKIPHAFLFSGPKGLGKTSAARIVAKAINCQLKKSKKLEPCNKCLICKNITQGTALDVIEIDAASNRGIDDIRDLKEKIKLAPSRAKKKVYIIDEVHMLTAEAFNALLKTLEEPPEHVVFILCTTQPQKLPATIISRCQQINFHQPSEEETKRALLRIIKAEKIKVADLVLKVIAKHSNNSFRDAVKNLEMLNSLYGKKISLIQAKEYFSQGFEPEEEFFSYLREKNTAKALKWLSNSFIAGVDPKSLLVSILTSLRKMLLAKFNDPDERLNDYGFSLEEIKKLILIFDQAGRQIKEAVLPQLPLELAIYEWGEVKVKSPRTLRGRQKLKVKSQNNKNKTSLDTVLFEWQEILSAIKKENPSLEALLKATKPIRLKSNILTVEVFYPFHKEKLASKKYVKIIEEKLAIIFKKPIKIKYFLRKSN